MGPKELPAAISQLSLVQSSLTRAQSITHEIRNPLVTNLKMPTASFKVGQEIQVTWVAKATQVKLATMPGKLLNLYTDTLEKVKLNLNKIRF